MFYPLASEASRGVYWNQAQKNFAHPYTEYPWVSMYKKTGLQPISMTCGTGICNMDYYTVMAHK